MEKMTLNWRGSYLAVLGTPNGEKYFDLSSTNVKVEPSKGKVKTEDLTKGIVEAFNQWVQAQGYTKEHFTNPELLKGAVYCTSQREYLRPSEAELEMLEMVATTVVWFNPAKQRYHAKNQTRALSPRPFERLLQYGFVQRGFEHPHYVTLTDKGNQLIKLLTIA